MEVRDIGRAHLLSGLTGILIQESPRAASQDTCQQQENGPPGNQSGKGQDPLATETTWRIYLAGEPRSTFRWNDLLMAQGYGSAMPAGVRQPNGGKVAEWRKDGDVTSPSSTVQAPVNAPADMRRVIRGGSESWTERSRR